MTFCCDKFEFHYNGPSQMGLNLRIIKLSPEFIRRGYLGHNYYRYLLTEGYELLNDKVKVIFIEYCPFCGQNLSKTYDSDKYINEVKHIW